jgi:hypothetical protein
MPPEDFLSWPYVPPYFTGSFIQYIETFSKYVGGSFESVQPQARAPPGSLIRSGWSLVSEGRGGFLLSCFPSLLAFVFDAKAWTERGGGDGIRESTGRDLGNHP